MISHAELLLADGEFAGPRHRGALAARGRRTRTRCGRRGAPCSPGRREGDQETASRLVGEELELVRRIAAPWVVGRTLRVFGELTGSAARCARRLRCWSRRPRGWSGRRRALLWATVRSRWSWRCAAARTGWPHGCAHASAPDGSISASSAASSSTQPLNARSGCPARAARPCDLAAVDADLEVDVQRCARPSADAWCPAAVAAIRDELDRGAVGRRVRGRRSDTALAAGALARCGARSAPATHRGPRRADGSTLPASRVWVDVETVALSRRAARQPARTRRRRWRGRRAELADARAAAGPRRAVAGGPARRRSRTCASRRWRWPRAAGCGDGRRRAAPRPSAPPARRSPRRRFASPRARR